MNKETKKEIKKIEISEETYNKLKERMKYPLEEDDTFDKVIDRLLWIAYGEGL